MAPTREHLGAGALRIARDREILDAVERALAGDPALEQIGSSPQLEQLRELTIGEFLDAVRQRGRAGDRPRHLQPLPAAEAANHDLRTRLSGRELDVVHLIVEGLSNKEISRRLTLSDKTVKNHISHILAKLKLTARTQVAVMALRRGLA